MYYFVGKGEEFLIILRAEPHKRIDIDVIMKRLRYTIEHLVTDGVPRFTVSIGYHICLLMARSMKLLIKRM